MKLKIGILSFMDILISIAALRKNWVFENFGKKFWNQYL